MSDLSRCPDVQSLMRLVFGQSNADETESISRHVADCESCVQTLQKIGGESLVRHLETQCDKIESRTTKEILRGLVKRLQSRSMNLNETTTAAFRVESSKSESSLPTGFPTGFLSAPQSADEIGWLNHYRVLRLLGAGGMGMVFEAEDTRLERRVAMKVMQPELIANDAARQRFLREARGMAAIKHFRITTIYEVGLHQDVPYLVMEFLEGEPLEDYLEREQRLDVAEVLRIGREIAEGLAAAHDHGLIHRDIKPANIWLEKPNRSVKILDFGLARPMDAKGKGLTASGVVMGTPNYMAPEQARGLEVDARCDLFSLGCVLYQMVAGELPFDGPSVMAILTALATEPPKSLRHLDHWPAPLIDLIEQLLAKNPEDRPRSAQAVVEALRAIEEGQQPVLVRKRKTLSRRAWLGLAAGAGIAAVVGIRYATKPGRKPSIPAPPPAGDPIKVGILHSSSGPMRSSEEVVIDATRFAIGEINEAGGVLGRRVQAVYRDGASDEDVFRKMAVELIDKEKVCTIFGCWTSASRKAVKDIVEEHNHLLIYPVQYEGLEQSQNIVYTGACPNQQIIPAVKYCYSFLKKRRFFLVGSDYIFPHTANEIIKCELGDLGGEVVGEEYLLLDAVDVGETVKKIVAAQPDVILNSINGNTNSVFFPALRRAGIHPEKVPTVSFSIAEQEIRNLPIKDMVGDYAAWNYFQSIGSEENKSFVERFLQKKPQGVVTDPMEAAYIGVKLWAQAVEKAQSDRASDIRTAIKGQKLEAPEGEVWIDPQTQHTWKTFRLGQIREDGQFQIVFASPEPMQPDPFLTEEKWRSRTEWQVFLGKLYVKWGNRWSNVGAKE
ncbi:MAG: hypothetical protein KatS3mg105_2066 [Gemmatales bacterium]|nr:MAG: hypothetical protein KatS3mg105_2066 [Gemmatales bacterium]